MITILFFIDSLTGGGAEKVLRNLVNHMDQSRFSITVQTVWPCDASKYLVPGIRYKSMYASANILNQLRYRAEAEAGLAYRLHIKDDYDIECAYLEMGTTKVMAASTNKKAKKLAWVHCDLKKKTGDTEAFVKKTADWYRKFDKVICVSEDARKSFVDLFGNAPGSVVLYNTIDDEAIRALAEQPCPTQKRKTTVLAIGRLMEEKGFDRLLDAHERLIREGYDYDLWILGEGPDREALESQIEANGLQDSVRLLGFQKNPYPYLKLCDLYVCSSRYEGMSTTAIEALILGKPIVTTDCSGMNELLGDSEFGLIMPNTVEGILQGLRTILSDTELCRTYAANALRRGEQLRKSIGEENRTLFAIRYGMILNQ